MKIKSSTLISSTILFQMSLYYIYFYIKVLKILLFLNILLIFIFDNLLTFTETSTFNFYPTKYLLVVKVNKECHKMTTTVC